MLRRSAPALSRFASPHYPFDSVYVINLDRRPDRWAHTAQQLKKENLFAGAVRISAVDGEREVDVHALAASGRITPAALERYRLPKEEKLFGMDLTSGAIGCALSHRLVWETVVRGQHQCTLILEDDAEFFPGLHRVFADRWSRVPRDWGLVYLGGLDLLSRDKPPRPYVADGVRYAYNGHRELTAYVVHARSAQRCLELSENMTWQIDTHICSVLARDDKAQDDYIADPLSYVFQPSLVIQLAKFGTDVQKNAEARPHMTDASRRMREFVGGGTSIR